VLGKLIITVTDAKLLHVHSVSPFSRQPPTPFKSRFNHPLNYAKGRKRCATQIGDSKFAIELPFKAFKFLNHKNLIND
jgi:hypothetical protein